MVSERHRFARRVDECCRRRDRPQVDDGLGHLLSRQAHGGASHLEQDALDAQQSDSGIARYIRKALVTETSDLIAMSLGRTRYCVSCFLKLSKDNQHPIVSGHPCKKDGAQSVYFLCTKCFVRRTDLRAFTGELQARLRDRKGL